jgi:undecaprenyl-diphosphatase
MTVIERHHRHLALGEPLPDLALVDTLGASASLDDFLGAGPVIIWYADVNDPTRLAGLRRYERRLDERGARVIVVVPGSVIDATRFAGDVGGPFAYFADADGAARRELGIHGSGRRAQSAYVIDRSGKLRWASRSALETREPHASAVVGALTSASGLPVPGPSAVLTPPIIVLAVALLVGLGALARFADHTLISWDRPVRDAVCGVHGAWFRSLMTWWTHLGDRYVLAPVTIATSALVWRRCRQLGATLLFTLPLGLLLEYGIKLLVARPRPSNMVQFNSSFPSGHTVAAVVFWGLVPPVVFVLTARVWAWATSIVVALTAVAGVAVSRVYLGAHWPSDVAGGVAAGALVLLIAEWFLRSRIFECDGCPLHPLRYGRNAPPLSANGRSRPTRVA